MDQLFYDIEGLKVFLDRTLNKFDIFGQKFAEISVDDQLLASGMERTEYYVRARMVDIFAHVAAEEMELDRRVSELGTSYVGKVYIYSEKNLKALLKAAIISVINDAVIFERSMDNFNQEVGDDNEKKG